MMSLAIAVVICTWNRADRLAETIEQMTRLEPVDGVAVRFLVIDNNSTDHTADVVKRFSSQLPLHGVFEAQQGKSAAQNRAIDEIVDAAGSTDWIVWTDDDVRVHPGWIRAYVDAINCFPECAFFGGPIQACLPDQIPDWLVASWPMVAGVYGHHDLGPEPRLLDRDDTPWGANFAVAAGPQAQVRFNTDRGPVGRHSVAGGETDVARGLLMLGHIGRWVPGAKVDHIVDEAALVEDYVRNYFVGQGRVRMRRQGRPVAASRRVRVHLGALKRHARYRIAFRTLSDTERVRLMIDAAVQFGRSDALRAMPNDTGWSRLSLTRTRSTLVSATRRIGDQVVGPPNETELITAAATNDVAAVRHLAKAGCDLDQLDSTGQSALAAAIQRRHFEAAGTLMALGAVTLDRQAKIEALGHRLDVESLHALRQRHRRAAVTEDPELDEAPSRWLADLERDGIVGVPGLVARDQLAQMQRDMATFVADLDDRLTAGSGRYLHYDQEEHLWEPQRAYITNNAFARSAALVDLCCDPEIQKLADSYFTRSANITRAVGMRYLPNPDTADEQFRYHHDMEDKRLKMMVLLTDVSESDQPMSYVAGSHRLFHPYPMFFDNSCPLDYCEKHLGGPLDVRFTSGRAGDIFFFDSNGAHKGNRRIDGAQRDAFFVEYCPDVIDLWGADIAPRRDSSRLPRQFDCIVSAEKRWRAPPNRTKPAWVDSLRGVSAWTSLSSTRLASITSADTAGESMT